ncbi:MAG: glutamine-hydrolyzing GMP synthase [Ilumatobacter sp.]|jgi:GMP synthase (glutamine-hydrolysing)|uniref:glutamine-hydrolyzing GMP synthase n=1 Tax=Ilumatobacter sp. TaxID=1967498 RepID=UPI003919ADBC
MHDLSQAPQSTSPTPDVVTSGGAQTSRSPSAQSGRATVLVVDFGAQYAQLIARRVRELHVYSEIVPNRITAAEIAERAPVAIILSGGPASVHVDGAPSLDPAIYDLGIPMLGICYGAQLLAQQLEGGVVGRGMAGEYGRTKLTRMGPSLILPDDAPDVHECWMSHFDGITQLPEGFVATASSAGAPVAVLENEEREIYGVQFHPEVVHSPFGLRTMERFLRERVGVAADWEMSSVIDEQVDLIRERVGDARVICGLSGGVDSSVAAALVHKAIGAQLTCIYVDTGLMRKNESEQVVETFRRNLGIELIHADEGATFFEALAGLTEPESKRKAIGERFIRVFEKHTGGLTEAKFLVQGTLYPDLIESGGTDGTASVIKSHHNVGGLPDDMELELIEPLRDLFKDEVRALGSELGLPDEMVWRQPFPGPGLGVRIIGEVTPERVAVLQEADAIVREELQRAGLERQIWQSYAALLADVRSVGVMGDERTYGHPVVIRAVTSDDAMTADWARVPYETLEVMSQRIINEVDGVNRVVYDITSKPPGTIEWE